MIIPPPKSVGGEPIRPDPNKTIIVVPDPVDDMINSLYAQYGDAIYANDWTPPERGWSTPGMIFRQPITEFTVPGAEISVGGTFQFTMPGKTMGINIGEALGKFGKGILYVGQELMKFFAGPLEFLTGFEGNLMGTVLRHGYSGIQGGVQGWMPLLIDLADDIVAAKASQQPGKTTKTENKKMVEIEVVIETAYYGEFVEFGYMGLKGWTFPNPFIRGALAINHNAIAQLGGTIQI